MASGFVTLTERPDMAPAVAQWLLDAFRFELSPSHDELVAKLLQTAAQVRTHLAEGARVAGRDLAQIEVTSLLPASVGDTRTAALAALRPGIAFYCGFFPRYNRMMAEHGFATEAAAIADAWARGDRGASERAVSDAMIDATSVSGTPEQCRSRIEKYRQSGIDLPIISPFARGPGAKFRFEAAIRARAPLKAM